VLACLAGQRLIAHLFPTLTTTFPGQAPFAIGLGLLGTSIALAGVMAFRKAQTTVDPTKPDSTAAIVQTGIYRLSRNPMYLGFVLVLMSSCAALGNPPTMLTVPMFVLYIARFQITPEERFLCAKFGIDYERYQQRTRRWI
jgi:protein-S-isoprenylcysteine O-methyltransferase Ste14